MNMQIPKPLPRLSPRTHASRTSCMAKLNKLGWRDGFAISNRGVRMGLRVTDPALLPLLEASVPPGSRILPSPVVDRMYSLVGGGADGKGARRFHLAYEDFGRVARTFDLQEAVDALQSSMRRYVAEATNKHLFVHAGVVAWKDRAILIPGSSFSGKTTLVAELVRAGATYYSDEYAALDSLGRVHPFAKKLSIRADETARQRDIAVEELGGTAGSRPLRVGLVVLTRYKRGAPWRPRRMSPGGTALALLTNTVAARRLPAVALDTFQRVVAEARAIRSARPEARDVARAILDKAAGL